MSTNIVSQMIHRARTQIKAKTTPVKLSEGEMRVQRVFSNDARIGNNEAFAELVFAITGFRPRCSTTTVVPFEVYYVGGQINKCALCVHSLAGQVTGCMGTTEKRSTWDATCRTATTEEAEKFINENAQFWTDPAFMAWFAVNVGAAQLQLFLDTLNS